MKNKDKIEKVIKNFCASAKNDVKTTAEMDARIIKDATAAHEKPKKKPSAELRPNIWRIIMKHRVTKFATVAIVIFAALIGIIHFGSFFEGSSVAYGISDIHNSVRRAKTIHIKGTNYYPFPPVPDVEQRAARFEYWLDIENGRARIRYPGYGYYKSDARIDIYYFEDVIVDQCRMKIVHQHKKASYYELQESENQFLISQQLDAQLKQVFGDPEKVQDFILLGEELIDDSMFDIWQADKLVDYNSGTMLRIKMWVSPTSHEIGRVSIWMKTENIDWSLMGEIDKIERDISFPSDIFDMTPPEDYAVINSEQAPGRRELARRPVSGKPQHCQFLRAL